MGEMKKCVLQVSYHSDPSTATLLN